MNVRHGSATEARETNVPLDGTAAHLLNEPLLRKRGLYPDPFSFKRAPGLLSWWFRVDAPPTHRQRRADPFKHHAKEFRIIDVFQTSTITARAPASCSQRFRRSPSTGCPFNLVAAPFARSWTSYIADLRGRDVARRNGAPEEAQSNLSSRDEPRPSSFRCFAMVRMAHTRAAESKHRPNRRVGTPNPITVRALRRPIRATDTARCE